MPEDIVLTVTKSRQWLLREPSKNSAQETELLFGHRFRVDGTENGWAYGQELSPLGQEVEGYKGWMRRKFLVANAAPCTHVIDALKAPVFTKSNIKSRITRELPMGAHITGALITAADGDASFVQLSRSGYIHRRHLRPLGAYAQSGFVSVAAAHYGLPYIWGGVSSDGLDCSGLVQSALRAVGKDCLRDAGQQESSLGTPLEAGTPLTRGDLVFWTGHVGIMEDSEHLLHANAFHMKVAREPLAAAIARIGAPSSIRRLSPLAPK